MSTVTDGVSADPGHKNKIPKLYPKIKVEKGDFVFLVSDGISDNLTAEEISTEMKKRNLSPRELFSWLSEVTTNRAQNAEEIEKNSTRRDSGVYSDGYKSRPKGDNRALAILEIK